MSMWRAFGRWVGRAFLLFLGAAAAVLLFHYVTMPVFVRHGQEQLVPDVRGLPLEEANRLVAASSLTIGRIAEAMDNHIPAGRVLRQNPMPGFRVKTGREINFVVSLGPAALTVPDLEGESLVHARFLLARDGIAVGKVITMNSRSVPADQVVAASPPPGTSLAGRTSVDLLVSRGALPERLLMPDLRGLEAHRVIEALEREGMHVIRRIWRGAEGRASEVIEQTPPPGYPIDRGGTIEIMTGN